MTRKTKIILLLVAAALFFILPTAYYLYIRIDRADKIAITLDTVPTDADVTIDGKKVNQGTIYLDPGDYTLTATSEGFKELTGKVRPESIQTYSVALQPESDEAKQWQADNQRLYDNYRRLNNIAAGEAGEYFNKKNPIAAKLPHRSLIHTIGYRMDPDDPSGNSIILEIDAREGYRQSALYQIRQLGFDPTDFKITFRDYTNPFPL